MLDEIYDWMKNLAFYLVIVTAVLEILPGDTYKKYIRFFAGMVMIFLAVTPFLRITGMLGTFQKKYEDHESEWLRQEMMERREYFERADIFDFLESETDPKKESEIRVEEIEIGRNQKTDYGMDTERKETSGKTTAVDSFSDRIASSGDRNSGSGE